ncbi:hypothetical protein WN51_11202 [Melipona quadrifasciata]|uniref:Uncharacterized protein n=1 Tax=Melipona quadrifasciata TaxID=166423 RepID=A0A0N0U620_9HYME|nr:hypothetical protein WN51_11202 [Melipona quadrifasciata]
MIKYRTNISQTTANTKSTFQSPLIVTIIAMHYSSYLTFDTLHVHSETVSSIDVNEIFKRMFTKSTYSQYPNTGNLLGQVLYLCDKNINT